MAESAVPTLPEPASPTARPARRRPIPSLIAGGACVALALTGTLLLPVTPILVWNASPSSPVGLYRVARTGTLSRGDIVVAWGPPWARRMAAERRYLPLRVPLVKKVAAVAGARICAKGSLLFVDGKLAAKRRSSDPSGRAMPWWTGCRSLRRGELLLLSPGKPEAFDGRYFGVTGEGEIVGKARLLWGA